MTTARERAERRYVVEPFGDLPQKWGVRERGTASEPGAHFAVFDDEDDARFFALMRCTVEDDNVGPPSSKMREALELLVDVQNGPPLAKYEADWNRAMKMAGEALAEKAGPGEGEVMLPGGRVVKFLGEPTFTVEGDLILNGAWCWKILPGFKGPDDDKPCRLMYRLCPVTDPDAYGGTLKVHSTREAALAANGGKPG
jgi:hypothetical protein